MSYSRGCLQFTWWIEVGTRIDENSSLKKQGAAKGERERELFVTVSGLSRSIIFSRKVLLTALIFSVFSCFPFFHLPPPPLLLSHALVLSLTFSCSFFFLQSLIVMLVHFEGTKQVPVCVGVQVPPGLFNASSNVTNDAGLPQGLPQPSLFFFSSVHTYENPM